MNWKTIVKLGKNVVCLKLNYYNIEYKCTENYFRLCKKLKQAMQLDYRYKYLSMRAYIQGWFDRVSNGEISVSDRDLIEAYRMLAQALKSDIYSQWHQLYVYLYDRDGNDTKVRTYKPVFEPEKYARKPVRCLKAYTSRFN